MKNICKNTSWILTTEHPHERKVRIALGSFVVSVALLYLFIVGSTIVNVMERKGVVHEMQRRNQEIAVLESNFLSLSTQTKAVDGERLGLLPVEVSAYVYRTAATAVLSGTVR